MAQDMNSGTQSQPNYSDGNKGSRMAVFAIIGIIIVAMIAWFLISHQSLGVNSPLSSTGPVFSTISQTQSSNSTAIYMSQAQAQALFGSSLNVYRTKDLFNNNYIINASVFDHLVPQLQGNITSGWITQANSSSSSYASIYYIVMNVGNKAPQMSQLVGAATISPYFMYEMTHVTSNSGSTDGLNYTYDQYSNATTWSQSIYGYKGDYVVVMLEYGVPGYLVNETQLVSETATTTP